MILHLLKTDWQRLRLTILGVWLVLTLSTLPWFFHEIGSFSAPFIEEQREYSDILDRMPAPLMDAKLARHLVAAAVLILSTAIGMHGLRWQLVSPVPPWKRIAAKLCAILAFIVGPQLVLGGLVLLLHNFSLPTVLAASAGTAISLTLLHAATALFAYRCGSVWVWAAASAVLLGAIFLIAPMIPGDLTGSLIVLTDPWAANRGPAWWAFAVTAVLALALLPGRRRPGSVSSVASAITAIVLASFAFHDSPATLLIPSAPTLSAEMVADIQAEIGLDGAKIDDAFSAPPGEFTIQATVRTSGTLPTGTFVAWSSPHPHWAWENRVRDPALPLPHSNTDRAALTAVLPAPLIPNPDGIRYRDNFLERRLPMSRRDSPEFNLPARGLVFRYQILAELPFSSAFTTTKEGTTTLVTRRHASTDPRPILEASAQFPAFGIATERTRLSWRPDPLNLYRFVLHLPHAGLCVQLDNFDLAGGFSPIPGGGAWSRQLLKPRHWPQPYDLRDARLIVLKTVVLAEIEREISVPREGAGSPGAATDWQLSRNYHLTLAAYLANHRPYRPDPATCTADEFARYLRAVSAIPFSALAARDLAEYAPRFSRLLALHSHRPPAAAAIARGTPDSERAAVFGALRENPGLASPLAATLVERNWHEEVAGLLLEEFARNPQGTEQWHAIGSPLATSIALLEDPTTYPVLLAALEQRRSFALYEIIRHLPGIDAALGESIQRMSHDLSPAAELAGIRHGLLFQAFDAFKVPVSHGNGVALSKLLDLWRMIPLETTRFGDVQRFTTFFAPEPAIPDTVEAWSAFIAGKSAADFTYDPLTRKWHAPSGQP